MLTEAQRELVAAGVDDPTPGGPLSRLLAASAEARKLDRELRRQRAALVDLPRHRVPAGFAESVAARLPTTEPLIRTRPRVADRYSEYGRMLPYAVAASIALLIGVGAFWLTRPRPAGTYELAFDLTVLPEEQAAVPTKGSRPSPAFVEQFPPRPTGPDLPPPDVRAAAPELAPAPRPWSPTPPSFIGAAVLMPRQPLDVVEARLPLLVSVTELDRPDVVARLTDELGRDAAFRVDLICADRNHGLTDLLAAAKEAGLATTVEATAAARRKRNQPTEWLFYTEALDDRQTADLLARLAAQSRTAGRSTDAATCHLFPALPSDQKQLHGLFGADVGLWKRPAERPKAAIPGGSVTAGTLDELKAALRPKNPPRTAIVLADQPAFGRANPFASSEIKTFLRDRGDRAPNTVPLMVVVRGTTE